MAIPKYKKGDWVRWCNNGKLVIGQIEYYSEDSVHGFYYMTDIGMVSEDSVLEARPPNDDKEK